MAPFEPGRTCDGAILRDRRFGGVLIAVSPSLSRSGRLLLAPLAPRRGFILRATSVGGLFIGWRPGAADQPTSVASKVILAFGRSHARKSGRWLCYHGRTHCATAQRYARRLSECPGAPPANTRRAGSQITALWISGARAAFEAQLPFSRQFELKWVSPQASSGETKEEHCYAYSRWLRDDLRAPAIHAHDCHAQRSLFESFGPGEAGSFNDNAARSGPGLQGYLRKLVQPSRRTTRSVYDAHGDGCPGRWTMGRC
jgi:hypothetical protein